ncbi:MAG: hypothetical protein ACE5NG_08115 [bacterium]
MNERILELLYRSFGETLSKEEQAELEEALVASNELQEEKRCISDMRQIIADSAERKFKPFFSTRVMRRIKAEAIEQEDFWRDLVWAFRRLALAGAIAIILLLANSVLLQKNNSLDSVLGMPQLTLEDTWQMSNIVEEEK